VRQLLDVDVVEEHPLQQVPVCRWRPSERRASRGWESSSRTHAGICRRKLASAAWLRRCNEAGSIAEVVMARPGGPTVYAVVGGDARTRILNV
jgi:hypothetical protein